MPAWRPIERNSGKRKKGQQKRITANDIPRLYPPGSDIIVQVTKGPIGTKGPRITTNISLAGRYLVLMPFSTTRAVFRARSRTRRSASACGSILNELDMPDNMGVIIRTVGEGQKARFFVRDLHVLLEQWKKISGDLETAKRAQAASARARPDRAHRARLPDR